MIRASGNGVKFTIDDQQKITGGNKNIRATYKKAKKEPVAIWAGPVAYVIFERMKKIKPYFFTLIERKDPPLENGEIN